MRGQGGMRNHDSLEKSFSMTSPKSVTLTLTGLECRGWGSGGSENREGGRGPDQGIISWLRGLD